MNQSDMVGHTFADLEHVVRDLCQQIQQVASRLPDEDSRAYAEAAKENLWRMYESAHQFALGLLLLRFIFGLIFFAHGAQKLFGWFGGQGLRGTTHMMEMLGLRPAKWWTSAAGAGETLGGLLMALGLFTPLAALIVATVMLVAMMRVHVPKGFWNSQGGYEYNLVLFMLAVVFALVGAGTFSLDALFGFGPLNPAWFLVGLLFLVILGLLVWQPTTSWVQKRWHVFQS